ncbi:MAG: threonine/serine exporter family protein [Lachnospiraceae bacterium]|jgi:uncharacterized membrane protein YjjP (DUF1212 family)|nr:threonine/serine exporter family protein [Lachnospiraceae bacterium]MDD3616609.1 threonine/serine exporter family protein [Lachnospiraceae bacterium]
MSRDIENGDYYRKVLDQLLIIGESMLTSGASVNRVEEMLRKMGKSYGAIRMDVFVITSCVIVTIDFGNGIELTQTRRILSPGGSEFYRVEDFTKLCDKCCHEPLSIEKFTKEIEAVKKVEYPEKAIYIGSALAASGFAVFFGGSLLDGILAALVGLFTCYCQAHVGHIAFNHVVYLLMCAFLSGLVITGMGAISENIHPDMIMIGDIMLLIPGIAMTNSVRDILVGDTISGLMRLIETIVWAGALACGFMIPMWIM